MQSACGCDRDTDGQCGKCRENALSAGKRFNAFLDDFLSMIERLRKEFEEKVSKLAAEHAAANEKFNPVGTCDGCSIEYADLALSKIVLATNGHDPEMAMTAIKAMLRIFEKRGVRSFPLTEKSVADLKKESGGTP